MFRHARIATFAAGVILMVGGGSPAVLPEVVYLICEPVEPTLCAALAEELEAVSAAQEVVHLDSDTDLPEAYGLAVEFTAVDRTSWSLSGFLSWRDPDGTGGTGPVIEMTVMDTEPTDRVLSNYASVLVRNSDLPF